MGADWLYATQNALLPFATIVVSHTLAKQHSSKTALTKVVLWELLWQV